MAKTRMNKDKRAVLVELAESLVDVSAEQAEADALKALLVQKTVAYVSQKFPVGEMVVLMKYGFAQTRNSINIRPPKVSWHERAKVEFPSPYDMPQHAEIRVPLNHVLWEAAQEWRNAEHRVVLAKAEKMRPYLTLIKSSRYYEDIVEVWAEARQARFQAALQLPASVTPDMVRAIQDDVARRASL